MRENLDSRLRGNDGKRGAVSRITERHPREGGGPEPSGACTQRFILRAHLIENRYYLCGWPSRKQLMGYVGKLRMALGKRQKTLKKSGIERLTAEYFPLFVGRAQLHAPIEKKYHLFPSFYRRELVNIFMRFHVFLRICATQSLKSLQTPPDGHFPLLYMP